MYLLICIIIYLNFLNVIMQWLMLVIYLNYLYIGNKLYNEICNELLQYKYLDIFHF